MQQHVSTKEMIFLEVCTTFTLQVRTLNTPLLHFRLHGQQAHWLWTYLTKVNCLFKLTMDPAEEAFYVYIVLVMLKFLCPSFWRVLQQVCTVAAL